MFDRLIIEFDKGLRTVSGVAAASRPRPDGGIEEADLDAVQRRHAARLMRVNHCGEVCAQALYQGQALAAGEPALRDALATAAQEETDHLDWCASRIHELGGRLSLLNPAWYAGSLAMGLAAGALGKRWNLGFLEETERQVEAHLQGHLQSLPPQDEKTRAIVAQMQSDEAAHAGLAKRSGARPLPAAVKTAMRLASGVMTRTAYWL